MQNMKYFEYWVKDNIQSKISFDSLIHGSDVIIHNMPEQFLSKTEWSKEGLGVTAVTAHGTESWTTRESLRI